MTIKVFAFLYLFYISTFISYYFYIKWDLLSFADTLIILGQSNLPIIGGLLIQNPGVPKIRKYKIYHLASLFLVIIVWVIGWVLSSHVIIFLSEQLDLMNFANNSQVFVTNFTSAYSIPVCYWVIGLLASIYLHRYKHKASGAQ